MSDTRYGPSGSCPRCRQFSPNCHCYASKKIDIAAIRARAEKATPGPWHSNTYKTIYAGSHTKPKDVLCLESDSSADAAFIAASRTDVPALCDALEAAEREIEDARAMVEKVRASEWAHAMEWMRGKTDETLRADAAEARVKELEAQLATARDDALEQAARLIECTCAPCGNAIRIRALKGAKR